MSQLATLQTFTIGTWNMEGKGSDEHGDFLRAAGASIWLLTEVPDSFRYGDADIVRSGAMGPKKAFAAVVARGLTREVSPHEASAAATWRGVRFICSVLPWRGAHGEPWLGEDVGERTEHALRGFDGANDELVWGGDWNHAFHGPERAGSAAGRAHIAATLDRLRLRTVTTPLSHRLGEGTIDHIAVPKCWIADRVERLPADGLSDHDAYVATVRPLVRADRVARS